MFFDVEVAAAGFVDLAVFAVVVVVVLVVVVVPVVVAMEEAAPVSAHPVMAAPRDVSAAAVPMEGGVGCWAAVSVAMAAVEGVDEGVGKARAGSMGRAPIGTGPLRGILMGP